MPQDLADLPPLGSSTGSMTEIDAAATKHIKFEIETVQAASFAESTPADAHDVAAARSADPDVLKSRLDQLLKQREAAENSQRVMAGRAKSTGPVPVVQKRRRTEASAKDRTAAANAAASALAFRDGAKAGGQEITKVQVAEGGTKPQPLPWTKEEIRHLKALVASEGAGAWQQKAVQLGTGRTAKAVHTRWLRDTGRIIDLPRGQKNMLNVNMTSEDVDQQAAILDQSAYLLPMVSGSLGLAFAAATD